MLSSLRRLRRRVSDAGDDSSPERPPPYVLASPGRTSDPKPTLIRRVTSKLVISIPARPQSLHARSPTSPKAMPSLPNSIVSKGQREAALRERGLLPPRKDLSEQEREADARLRCVPLPAESMPDGLTDAERLRVSWIASNRSSESSDLEWRPPAPPYMHRSRSRTPSTRTSSSSDARIDMSSPGRLSTCSSCPPLSTSSNLEVLPEESELLPVTPPPPTPSKLMITVSNPNDPLPSPIIIDSPVSCTFSTGPSGFSQEEKENKLPRTSRRSSERSRRVGPALSAMGSRSLTNLRRSIVGSLRLPSSTTLSTADGVPPTPTSLHLPAAQAPRTAISPTIYSLGSILWETKDIQDVESRRLSELAFLH